MVLFRDFKPGDAYNVILKRLAVILNDVPENIIIRSRSADEIDAITLQNQIQELAKQRKYSKLEPLTTQLLKLKPSLNPDNIVYEYILYKRPTYKQFGPEGEGFFRLNEEPQLVAMGYKLDSVLNQLVSYESNRQRLLNQLEQTQQVVETQAVEMDRLPSLKYTPFQVETTTWYIEAIYNDYRGFPSDVYALDLFNACMTTQQLLFIQLNYLDQQYTKIHTPLPEFKIEFEDYPMTAVIREKSNWYYIYFDFSVGSNKFKIIFNSLARKTQDTVLDILWNHLPEITKSGQMELNVRGDFIVENVNVNYLALADIIFNNPLYTQYLYMDESSSVVSKKTRINIHYKLSSTQKILFMLNNEGDNIRVRISKAVNKQSVQDFSVILGKLLAEYKNLEPNIVQIYADFNIDITEKEKKLIKKGKKVARQVKRIDLLKEAVPDLFLKQYARKCQGDQQPTIVDNPQFYESKGYQVVEFPQQPNRDNKYYICESRQYPYPGLQQNTLSNKDIYPYIPCCFETQQLNTNIPNYIQEYIRDKESTKPKDTTHVITILKVIDLPNRIGNLPKIVGEWLGAFLGEECQRRGVEQGPLNFIHAVLSAVDSQYQTFTTSEERARYVKNYLGSLLRSNIHIEACKQSNYELGIDQIRDMWLDSSKYHDVLRFMRLLELYHKIKIIVISPDKILVPRFIDFYARTPINLMRDKIVLLFNHYGSESSDALVDAHNELIVTKTGNTFFEGRQAEKLYEVYVKAVQFYETPINQPLQFKDIDNPRIFLRSGITPIKQYIDAYGKCRLIIFKHNDFEYTMQIPPSMPYNLKSIPLDSIMDYDRPTIQEALDIIKNIDGTPIAKSASDTPGIWFQARLMDDSVGGSVFFIPTNEEPMALPVRDEHILWDTLKNENHLNQLRIARKNANTFTSILFYILRLFNKKLPMSDENINSFIDDYTIVKENHVYITPSVGGRILPPIGDGLDPLNELERVYPSYISNGRLICTLDIIQRIPQILKSDVGIYRHDPLLKNIFMIADFMTGGKRPLPERDIIEFIERSTIIINGYKYDDVSIKKVPSTMDELVGIVPKFFDSSKKLIIGFPELRQILSNFLGSDIPIGEFYTISNYFAYNYDFISHPDEKVFIGQQQFTNYMGVYKNFENIYISDETQPGNPFPYFMKFPFGVGIIQNTEYGTKEAALSVLKHWKTYSFNPGFKVEVDSTLKQGIKIVEYSIEDGQWKSRSEGVGDEYLLLRSGDYYSACISARTE